MQVVIIKSDNAYKMFRVVTQLILGMDNIIEGELIEKRMKD